MYEFRETTEVYHLHSCDDRKGLQTTKTLKAEYAKLADVLECRQNMLLSTGFVRKNGILVREENNTIEAVLLSIQEVKPVKPLNTARESFFD